MNVSVKEYLDNIRNYKGITNAYNEQLLVIKLIGYTAPTPSYNNVGGRSGTQKDSVQERYIVSLEECKEKIQKNAIAYAEAAVKFYDELELMPNSLYRLVLLLYYGSKKSVKEVAKEIDKSESHTKRILAEAREQFSQIKVACKMAQNDTK